MRRFKQASIALASSTIALIALSSCGSSSGGDNFPRALAESSENITWEPFPSNVIAAMPSTRYVSGNEVDIALSDAVVTGKFIKWERGKALTWEGGSDTGTEVDWDGSPTIRRVVLDLEVDSVIDLREGTKIGDTVSVTVPVDANADADAVGDGLVGLGDVVVYLTPFHDGGWGISLESTLVGELMDDGTVDLPILDAAAEGTTLNMLRSASPALTILDMERAADEEVVIDLAN